MEPEEVALLRGLVTTIQTHVDSEEASLVRIERLLDGNGQPGLVRSAIIHDERLRAIEAWKGELAITRRWLIGLILTTAVAVIAMLLNVFQHAR